MFTDSHSLFWVEVHYVDRHQKMRFEYEKGTKDQEVQQRRAMDEAPLRWRFA